MENARREKLDVPFASDAEVIEMVDRFERCDWPYRRWTHRAHLGVALCYLRAYPFEEALARVRHHLALYNRTLGDADGYHETITVLFLRGVAGFLQDHSEVSSLADTVEELARLYDMRWPLRYYSPERLWSAEARADWVDPDRQPLDFAF